MALQKYDIGGIIINTEAPFNPYYYTW